MNSNLLRISLAALCIGLITGPAFAAPLRRADVSASPVWILHVDCDALRPTAVGQFILSELEKPEAQAKLAAFEAIFGIDPRSQLHGLTVYSSENRPQDGVLLVYADFDPDRLVTLARAAHDYQSTKHKKHVIHNWIDDKKKPKNGVPQRTYAAIDGKRILFGQHEDVVADALDVLDGATPNLASSKAYPQLGAGSNFLQAAARKMDIVGSDPKAQLFKLSKLIWLDVGQAGQQLKATLNLEAENAEVADSISAIAQGLVALLKVQQDKPESSRLAQALSLKQDGADVTVTLSMPEDQAIDLYKASQARKAEKKADRLEDK